MPTFLRATVLALALLLLTDAAAAQSRRELAAFAPPINRREVTEFARVLHLDQNGTAMLTTLYQGYRDALRQVIKDTDAIVEALEANVKNGLDAADRRRNELRITDDYMAKVLALERTFMQDVAAMAPRPEAAAAVQRARRRTQGFRFDFPGGDGVDLIRMADDLKLQRPPEIDALLVEYELELDRIITAKPDALRVWIDNMREGQQPTIERLATNLGRMYESGVPVRDLNRRYLRRLRDLLPPDDRTRVEQEFERRAYRVIHQRGGTPQRLEAAAAIESLTPEQRDRLTALVQAYQRDVGPVNAAWASALDDKLSRFTEEMLASHSTAAPVPDDPLVKACNERLKLDRDFDGRIQQILSAPQREELNKRGILSIDAIPAVWPGNPGWDERDGWDEWEAEEET